MSLNVKLLAGSLLLAAIAIASFTHAHWTQNDARQLSWQVFARGVEPIAALQAAHGRASALEARYLAGAEGAAPAPDAVELVTELGEMLARLGEATAALSPDAPAMAPVSEARYSISRLRASQGEVSERLLRRELGQITDRFERAVVLMRADITQMRDDARRTLADWAQIQAGWLAILLLAILLVTATLFTSFAMPFRAATAAVRSLDEDVERPLDPARRRHFPDLFAALTALQSRFIERERAGMRAATAERARLEDELERQRKRFEGTIDNMAHGYCLLDERRALVAANAPFRRMFHRLRPGASAKEVEAEEALEPLFHAQAPRVVVRETADGEVIEVRRHTLSGRGTIITVQNITEQRAVSQRIEKLAGCDALTGLPNRARFYDRLRDALQRDNKRADIAVLCLDLEGFRNINATFGNAVGDIVLRTAAERLAHIVGEHDFLARTGADEFAIIRRADGQPQDCEALAATISAAFEVPVRIESGEIAALPTIGMVHLKPRGQRVPLDPYAVMQDGEMALARARTEKPGSRRFFSEDMRREMDARRQMEADLRLALAAGQFELHYQPFVDVSRGAVSGFEALLRWHHPVRGTVSPSEFIPLAEQTGLIDEIGLWVLREACRTAAGWPATLDVSVNLSPLQFRDPALVRNVAATLAGTGLSPSRLQLEVTESVFLDEGDGTLDKLAGLRALGLKISMDDFGTGYSSLGYLSRFPFDKIKIDQSFVRRMERPENAAIVRAVIGLSSAMGMSVIAEGVETRGQFETLCRDGCREMQGYLFSRPCPAADLVALVARIDGAFARGEFPIATDIRREALSAA